MNGINANEIILDTMLSADDMANYQKNFDEMSKLFQLPFIMTRFTPTPSKNAAYAIQTGINSSGGYHSLSDESFKIESGIIKVDPNVFSGVFLITQYTLQLDSYTVNNDIIYERIRYYQNDDFTTPVDYPAELRFYPIQTVMSSGSYTITFMHYLTPTSPICGYSIEMCNSKNNEWKARGSSTCLAIGVQNNI